jgi:hypothetical protein
MGAKLFDAGSEIAIVPSEGQNGIPSRHHTIIESRRLEDKYPKATFYLPIHMLERLDKLWIARRNKDRRIKKSDLVREALENYLAEHDRRRPKVGDSERINYDDNV